MLHVRSMLSDAEEAIVSACINCGIAVHRELGPGFKESIYHRALLLEFDDRGLKFETEKAIAVKYRKWEIPGQRVDLIVENTVLIEVKAVPKLKTLHRYQVQSYLRTMGLGIGLIMNFRSPLLKQGLRRVTP
jgi:GxxExxY protein